MGKRLLELLSVFVLLMVVAAVLLIQCSKAQTSHLVGGDSLGWTIPVDNATYIAWAASQIFTVGDVLVFNYTTGAHDVAEVIETAFSACSSVNPISIETNGPTNLTLSYAGEHYFICTSSGHCATGQKLAINVSDKNGNYPQKENVAGTARKTRVIVAIVIATVGAAFLVTCALSLIWYRKKSSSSIFFWRKSTTTRNDHVEAFLQNNGSLALKRFTYPSIKKVTDAFREKLGQGGYGGVYKGQLLDGRLVAVKLLNETKGNGEAEEFVNEVASISRTSHVNVVSLVGYCFEGSKRALIYEYMVNGSLEKFIGGKKKSRDQQSDNRLEWNTMHRIAVGVARGLEYLHRGCGTRIFHFDIKPHNILLDEEFCPKISDFGLAKLCPTKESNVSMLHARGTIGYIAPEVFSRQFGRVSHKADVYSYGMLVLEMVGVTENTTTDEECVREIISSEIYFPCFIYKKLECDGDLGLEGIKSVEDEELARKMILVGLWCIQAHPSVRPGMSKVIEMLEGNLESLQVPPEQLFLSPPLGSLSIASTSSIVGSTNEMNCNQPPS